MELLAFAAICLAGVGQLTSSVVLAAAGPGAVLGGRAGEVAASVSRTAQGSRSCAIRYWNEARYRSYAYDHIVHIRSGCPRRVHCTVSTNVNPKSMKVSVRAAGQTEVLTFRGSPSRVFASTITCELSR